MGALRVVGGALALIGAGLIFFMAIIFGIDHGFQLGVILALILPILAMIGGILAISEKKSGGILALVVGIIWLTMAILVNLGFLLTLPEELLLFLIPLPGFSVFLVYLGFSIWGFFLTVEVILVFVGGILATVAASDQ